jgi:hypothetical protein
MGRRPLPAVRDLTRGGRWSTYDVSVVKKMEGGGGAILARLGHFPPVSQAQCSMYMSFFSLVLTVRAIDYGGKTANL